MKRGREDVRGKCRGGIERGIGERGGFGETRLYGSVLASLGGIRGREDENVRSIRCRIQQRARVR